MDGFELDMFYSLFTKETEREDYKRRGSEKYRGRRGGLCVYVCVGAHVKVSDINV